MKTIIAAIAAAIFTAAIVYSFPSGMTIAALRGPEAFLAYQNQRQAKCMEMLYLPGKVQCMRELVAETQHLVQRYAEAAYMYESK